jgi:hypothetical protein
LLATLRQIAWDKLAARDDNLRDTRERHAAKYAALAERLDPAALTEICRYRVKRSGLHHPGRSHDNIQLALTWCLHTRSATDGLQLIRALAPLWMWLGLPLDGRRWVDDMLDLAAHTSGVPPALYAQALTGDGIVAQVEADPARSRMLLERSVALWRSLGDSDGLAMALSNLDYDHAAIATRAGRADPARGPGTGAGWRRGVHPEPFAHGSGPISLRSAAVRAFSSLRT